MEFCQIGKKFNLLFLRFFISCRELTSLNQSLPKKRQALTRAQDSLHTVQDRAARLYQQVNTCRGHVEETRSALHANKSRYTHTAIVKYPICTFLLRGRVLDALMQQKSSGAIPGICGRLVSFVTSLVSFFTC